MENDKSNEPDKRIRAKLEANELKPDAALWKDIERELDKSKRRRGGFFRRRYLLLLLLLIPVGTGIGLFMLQQKNANTETITTNTTDNSNSTNNQIKPGHQAVENDGSDVAKNNDRDNQNTNIPAQSQPVSSTSDGNQNDVRQQSKNNTAATNTNNHVAAAKPMKSDVSTSSTQSEVAPEQNYQQAKVPDSISHQAVEEDSDKNPDGGETGNDTIQNQSGFITPTLSETRSDSDIVQRNEPTTVSDNHLRKESFGQAVDDVVTKTDSAAEEKFADSSYVAKEVLIDSNAVLQTQTDTVAILPENLTTTTPEKNKRNIQLYAGPFIQYNVVSKTIDADNVRPEYLERRRSEEKKTTAVSYGLQLGLDVNRFVVQSGITLRAYADDVQYENRKLCYDIKNHGSQFAPLYDTVSVHSEISEVIGSRNGKAVNRYVELPLLVGYRIGSGSFFVRPVVGIAVALPSSWSSEYLDQSVTGLVDGNDIGLRPAVFSLLGEITASRALGSDLFLDLGLNYNRNLTSVFSETSGIRQRYTSVGGRLGLTWRF